MIATAWRGGALAIGAVLLSASIAKSADEDTIRLGRMTIDNAPPEHADLLKLDDDSDIVAVRGGGGGGRGGFGGGGYRGGYGGGYRGGYAGYGGYRGGWGYGRGWGGYGWGGYYGFGWGYPYYYGGYYPYYYPTYYGAYPYYGGYYFGVNATPVVTGYEYAATAPYSPRVAALAANAGAYPLSSSSALNPNATYQYNGGPANPVPLPQNQTAPQSAMDRFVSTPAPAVSTTKYSYAAYGSTSSSKPAGSDDTKVVVSK